MAKKYANFFIARLSSDISASDVEIPITDLPKDDSNNVITEGKLVIDAKRPDKREVIGFTGVDGSKLTGVTRGLGRTLATTHQRNATIEMTVLGSDLTEIYEVADIIGVPVGVRQEYFGTKATFNSSPYRHGWLFMEKNVAYPKADNQRLYDHLKAVDAASVKTDSGATFMFADKWFGTGAQSLDTNQTEFNALGKSGGAKTHTLTEAQMPSHSHNVVGGANNIARFNESPYAMGSVTSIGTGNWSFVKPTGGGQAHNNLQPYLTINYIIKT